MKYYLITYGCQMNTADSEEMALPMQARGFRPTEDIREADIVLMNTCTVREHAEHKAYSNLGRLREWKEEDPNRLLIVAGCAATLWGESVKKKYPYIDLVSPATRIEMFPEVIEQLFTQRKKASWLDGSMAVSAAKQLSSQAAIQSHSSPFGSAATAYVTIMRGCNLSCSYCIVPSVRGREKYRPLPDVLDEIRAKAAQGYREVMLLGQTVNSYYYRKGVREYGSMGVTSKVNPQTPTPPYSDAVVDFADLLCAVNAIEGIECIRFMSPHPKHMRTRVIEAIAQSPKVARHVHLPAQSGSDQILARMKRLYTRAEYLATLQAMRDAIPGLEVTTDIIVGYPGETQDDFQDTLSFLDKAQFQGLFAFKYSPRPGTASAELREDVSEEVKEERLQRVLAYDARSRFAQKAVHA